MILRAQVEREVGRLTDAQWDFLFREAWSGKIPAQQEQLDAFMSMVKRYCRFSRLGKMHASARKAKPVSYREQILRCARAVARALSVEEEIPQRETIGAWLVRTDDGGFDWTLRVEKAGKPPKDRPQRWVAWFSVEVPLRRPLTSAEVLASWMVYTLLDSAWLRCRLEQLGEPTQARADKQDSAGGSE
jgi:hypothetical protein